jgi:hypothetical protein
VVPQQTPRAVISDPPSFVTLPPDTALVCVAFKTFSVVSIGGEGFFLQDCIIAIVPIARKTITMIFRKRFIIKLLKYLEK